MSQSAMRRLTKEDAVKLSPQLSNLYVYLLPFRTRVLAVKKILRDSSSKIYEFSNNLFTAITKLPKTSGSQQHMPVVWATKDIVTMLTRNLNQFQTLWSKYKVAQTNALAIQLAGVLVDIVNDFIVNQDVGYRTLKNYRETYGIGRQDPVINSMNETVENNLAVPSHIISTNGSPNMPGLAVAVPGAPALQVTTTPYRGIHAKKCVDPVMFESQNIDLTTAILHIVENTGKKIARTYCLDADSIKGYLGDLSMVFYQCRPSVPLGAIMIRPESVFPTKIRRLPFDFAVYVYESEIQQIKPGNQYVLVPTEKAVGRIASHTVITGGSVVSAQHCQNNYTQDFIYSVKELGKLPTQTESAKKRQLAAEVAEEAMNYFTKRAVTRVANATAAGKVSTGSNSPKTRRMRRR